MNVYISIQRSSLLIFPLLSSLVMAATYDNKTLLENALNNRSLHENTVKGDKDLFKRGKPNNPIAGWFISTTDIDLLVNILMGAFQGKTTDLDSRDMDLIKVLRKDLDGYYVSEPKLTYVGPYKGYTGTWERTPVYEITGWNTFLFDPQNSNTLRKFIRMFLAGAHFVVVGNNDLLSDIGQLPHAALNNAHSHYHKTARALVYPDIIWASHSPAPIIAALLIDDVILKDKSKVGTFFQLEGWPVHGKSGSTDKTMHGKDFVEHAKTVWNISTYGMSPYSEKRGTTIFLTKGRPNIPELNKLSKTTFKEQTKLEESWDKYAIDKRQ